MSLPSADDLWSHVMRDLHADFWPKTKTGIQGEGSILFDFFVDESWNQFRVKAKRLVLLKRMHALTSLVFDTLLRDDKAGKLTRYRSVPAFLAAATGRPADSYRELSSMRLRQSLADASVDVEKTGRTVAENALLNLLREMLAQYPTGSKVSCTIEWFEDELAGDAFSLEPADAKLARTEKHRDERLASCAAMIRERCERARRAGMPEDAAAELAIALDTAPQTMLPELQSAVFPLISVQAKHWLENSGYSGAHPAPDRSIIKSQNIDLKLVERWRERFASGQSADEGASDIESAGPDIQRMISAVKRDRTGARVTGSDILIPLLVDRTAGVGLYLFGDGWFKGHEDALSDSERAALARNRCMPAPLITTGVSRRFELFGSLEKPALGDAAPNRLRHDIERIVTESCDLLTNAWNCEGIQETLTWYRQAQMSAHIEHTAFALDNYEPPAGTPERYLRYFER